MARAKKELKEDLELEKDLKEDIEDKDPMADIREQRKRMAEIRTKIKKENPEVLMMNAVSTGQVYYRCPKSGMEFQFHNYGDTDYIEFETLVQMKNQHPKMLTDYVLIPVSVLHEGIELEDIIEALNLQDVYKDDSILYEDNLDQIVEMSIRNLEKFMDRNSNEKYSTKIAERAIARFKDDNDDFTDKEKLMLILSYTDTPEDLYDDIVEAQDDLLRDKIKSKKKK